MLPDHVTHYYEEEYGPFLNICDLSDAEAVEVCKGEEKAATAFNRFALGTDFLAFRRAADDLLVGCYLRKFGFEPPGRPYYGVLGEFDKTLSMYRRGQKVRLSLGDFEPEQITFMYPDHAHLVSLYDAQAPRLFYQLPDAWQEQAFWGKLMTFDELRDAYSRLGIGEMVKKWQSREGWSGCYVEAHIWDRSLRDRFSLASGRTG